jgi:hypothetical protein
MIDFIPLSNYEFFYNCLVGLVVFIVSAYTFTKSDSLHRINPYIYITISILFIIVWFFLGLRPISYTFGDMGNYNLVFSRMLDGYESSYQKSDIIFDFLMSFSVNYLNAEYFFFICFTIYIVPFYIALKRLLGNGWVLGFAIMIALFSFYSFGVNGIRNGMATSIVLLAISYKGPVRWLLFFVAVNIHTSTALPAMAVLLFIKFKNINYYVLGWLFCLVISITVPSIGNILSNSGLLNDKLASYNDLDMTQAGTGRVGFRIDFLLFGLLPILIGLFYRYKLKFIDPTYDEILAIYLTANAVWLIVIRIPFSNRVAYLSWFLYGLVIAYPMIKSSSLRYSNRYFALLLAGLFTFSVTFF